jgi:tRNA modification GTPase
VAAPPSYGDLSPIAAIATPLGESALAVIRVSGPNALDLLAAVFSRPGALQKAPGNTAIHGWILESGTASSRVDEVVVTAYRVPRSYTGEDGADISCHGGIAPARAVMRVLHTAGFRDALPGEFTFRAFMNGKLDLTKAESVMELVAARTDLSRKHAIRRLSGGLEAEIRGVKDLLVHALAGMELLLDYSEDEADPEAAGASGPAGDFPLVEDALSRLRALAASYRRERLYRDGALVVIAGRPNAGKSSLFNLLIKEERAIVTPIPGTTRDWLEAWISIEGVPIRLADTAGLHAAGDPVERLGMERSRELLAGADLAIYLIDGATGPDGEDTAFLREYAAPVIPVFSKADLAPDVADGGHRRGAGPANLAISARTGEGIPALTTAISAELEAAFGGSAAADASADAGNDTPGIATARQKELVNAAITAVEEALDLEARRQSLDIIAPLIREAVNALGEITGEVSTAEILETMFSRFCVGK